MDDLLNPVKTVKRVQGNIEKFEALTLKEHQPSDKSDKKLKTKPAQPKRPIVEIEPNENDEPASKVPKTPLIIESPTAHQLKALQSRSHKHHDSTAFVQQSYLNSPAPSSLSDNAREILRSQPSHQDLLAVLQYLQFGIDGQHDFNIRITSSKAAQIINVLVTVTIPEIWINLKQKELSEDEAKMKKIIVRCLGGDAGIGALLSQIKQLSASKGNETVLYDTIIALAEILKGANTVYGFLNDVQQLYESEIKRRLYWQELTALIAGSRILSTVSEAWSKIKAGDDGPRGFSWLTNGTEYTEWLAKNIRYAAIKLHATESEDWKRLAQFVKHGLSLGHRDLFVTEIYSKLLLGPKALWTPLHLLLGHLAPHEQKNFFDSVLFDLGRNHLASAEGSGMMYSHDPELQKRVAGAAALIAGIIKNNEMLEEHVESWLIGTGSKSATIGLSSRRALIAAFGRSEDKLRCVLEKSLDNFGDKIQIQHASIMHQEATAQMILLLIGRLARINVNSIKHPSISTPVMHAVSNRLSASIPQTRLLGMVIGTAVSKLVDKGDNVLNFGVEEMETETVQVWLGLVSVEDSIGSITDLLSPNSTKAKSAHIKPVSKLTRSVPKPKKQAETSKIIAIEEISGSSETEDEDLIPYQKPDSDPEDSDEDPTLINRSKPSAPVYITDLIKQLQSSDKPDVISLALKTAPSLISRKSGFGTELSDNIQTLVTILINLQEGMTEPELQHLRLESLLVCCVAKPEVVGPSLAKVYFQGDFSLSQRITILTAVGLAARRLAGFNEDGSTTVNDLFPSKRLPMHLEPQSPKQITATRNPVAMLTDTAAHTTIRPMALQAADKVTGPSALKIRTFSSRMDVEKKSKEKNAARTKVIPKTLHKILVESIYLPFCSHMSLLLSYSTGARSFNSSILHSSTLRLFLQTLTLVLHTMGPSAGLHLPTLTHETLLILLNLRNISHLSTDPAILPALLHLLLALIDITIEAGATAQERLVTDYGGQVSEMVNWSNSLGSKISVPDSESEEGSMPWTVLAAGIQVKWFEIGKRFQGRMLGLSMDEMDQLAGT